MLALASGHIQTSSGYYIDGGCHDASLSRTDAAVWISTGSDVDLHQRKASKHVGADEVDVE